MLAFPATMIFSFNLHSENINLLFNVMSFMSFCDGTMPLRFQKFVTLLITKCNSENKLANINSTFPKLKYRNHHTSYRSICKSMIENFPRGTALLSGTRWLSLLHFSHDTWTFPFKLDDNGLGNLSNNCCINLIWSNL